MTDDPRFFAWLDGELAEPEARAMAERVAADPALAARAAEHRALGARLAAAFAPVAAAPVPERLAAAASAPPPAEVHDLAAARARRARPTWSLAGLAVAASLALGLGIGVTLSADRGNFAVSGETLAAAGPLDRALTGQLAAAGEQDGIRLGTSFRDRDGRFCRSFSAGAQSGLACRAGEGWAVEGLVGAAAGQKNDYRMAAGPDPALGALIDARIAGEPLDPAAEAAALRSGWAQGR